MAKPTYPGMMPGAVSKKELLFPPDCVEGVSISTFKRKKLNSKNLAPFEAWRLMLALKSGQLAESTWALDTLNILLYDDTTHSYFSLSSLPGLLEVLTEHLRHCLMQIFSDFDDLEAGFKKPARRLVKRVNGKRLSNLSKPHVDNKEEEGTRDCVTATVVKEESGTVSKDIGEHGASFKLEGTNYTLVSRKGLAVKFDPSPTDCSVLETKDWDLYTKFEKTKDHWLSGCGDLTEHIQTYFESDSTHKFLSGRFCRKRTRLEAGMEDDEEEFESAEEDEEDNEWSNLKQEEAVVVKSRIMSVEQYGASSGDSLLVSNKGDKESESLDNGEKEDNPKSTSVPPTTESQASSVVDSDLSTKIKEEEECVSLLEGKCAASSSSCNHSKLCNGSDDTGSSGLTNDTNGVVQVKNERMDIEDNQDECSHNQKEAEKVEENKENNNGELEIVSEKEMNVKDENNSVVEKLKEDIEKANAKTTENVPIENGELEEPKLSPMTTTEEMNGDLNELDKKESTSLSEMSKKEEEEEDCPPPVLKAECMDVDLPDTQLDDSQADSMEDSDVPSLPLNSTMNTESSVSELKTASTVMLDATIENEDKENNEKSEEVKSEGKDLENDVEEKVQEIATKEVVSELLTKEMDTSFGLNDSLVSETEEMSASFVADLLKEEENTEEEAFQRDDPPLCVTEENRDELGRRCVCISNILRSLSCVPGNEIQLCKHAGVMKILGRLLLLHHSHPTRPPPRKLPRGEEEEKEEPPRVYDDEHWWWDYLDQLRENTLVILANICSHLMLSNFSEQLCFPLLEGLLHWVICPASVAKDPLPTLSAGSSLSPQRLVLEALCKLCIYETNVDLLLATPPMKRLLELFAVLVNLLADREHQITREFSIVLLSLLVQGDSSVARALALQHPCVSVLVDFLETAEKNALNIANQQGLSALQSNPEAMGTSLDMLRRAASILLHMARVPDNRKLFIQQQSRLLNLVMSQILDQSVANTLSEVLFECSQQVS